MAELKYVGKRSRPEDGLEKVTGKARYVGDYYLPEMLYAKILRSPLPHTAYCKAGYQSGVASTWGVGSYYG